MDIDHFLSEEIDKNKLINAAADLYGKAWSACDQAEKNTLKAYLLGLNYNRALLVKEFVDISVDIGTCKYVTRYSYTLDKIAINWSKINNEISYNVEFRKDFKGLVKSIQYVLKRELNLNVKSKDLHGFLSCEYFKEYFVIGGGYYRVDPVRFLSAIIAGYKDWIKHIFSDDKLMSLHFDPIVRICLWLQAMDSHGFDVSDDYFLDDLYYRKNEILSCEDWYSLQSDIKAFADLSAYGYSRLCTSSLLATLRCRLYFNVEVGDCLDLDSTFIYCVNESDIVGCSELDEEYGWIELVRAAENILSIIVGNSPLFNADLKIFESFADIK